MQKCQMQKWMNKYHNSPENITVHLAQLAEKKYTLIKVKDSQSQNERGCSAFIATEGCRWS